MAKISRKIIFIDQFRQCGHADQGLIEYVIIVAMIAVAAISVYSVFGQTVPNRPAGLSNALPGKPAKAPTQAAGIRAQAAATPAQNKKNMADHDHDSDTGAD